MTVDFWHQRPVLVTGGFGFLGSHLVARLVDLGAEVVVLARDQVPPTGITRPWADRVAVVRGPVEDYDVVERAVGEYDVATVFHLAAQTQVGVANRNPLSTYEANIKGTWTLLEAARRSPLVGQVVVASSDKAYGEQPVLPYEEDMALLAAHPYDVSKACADLLATTYAASYGLGVAVTRCGNLFGPGDTNWARLVPGTIRSLHQGQRPLIRSDGTLTRDYVFVDDAVAFYLQLAEALADRPELAGEVWNFSNERPLDVLAMVALVAEAMGVDLEPDVRGEASNEIPHQYLSARKAREVLGWRPAHTIEAALATTVPWYRELLGP